MLQLRTKQRPAFLKSVLHVLETTSKHRDHQQSPTAGVLPTTVCLSPGQAPLLCPCAMATFGKPEQTTFIQGRHSRGQFISQEDEVKAQPYFHLWSQSQQAPDRLEKQWMAVTYLSGDTAALLKMNPPPKKRSHHNTKQLGSSSPKAARQHFGKTRSITTEIRGWLNSHSPPTTQTPKALLLLSNLHSTGIAGFLHRSTCHFLPWIKLKICFAAGQKCIFSNELPKNLPFKILAERNSLICSKSTASHLVFRCKLTFEFQ